LEFASLVFPRRTVAHFALSPPVSNQSSERQQGFRQTHPSFSKAVNRLELGRRFLFKNKDENLEAAV
jgi:hypothetical protein